MSTDEIQKALNDAVSMLEDCGEGSVYHKFKHIVESDELDVISKFRVILHESEYYCFTLGGLCGISPDARSMYNKKLVEIDDMVNNLEVEQWNEQHKLKKLKKEKEIMKYNQNN